MKPIIDISEFNKVTNWFLVKQNVQSVIIRMGYRGSILGTENCGKIVPDKKYLEHRNACRNLGIPHSFYYFPTGITTQEIFEEADWVARELTGFKDFATPVFADSEMVNKGRGRADTLNREQRTMLLRLFCARLQSKGIPAGVYASTSWLENQLDMSKLPFSVWVAQYAEKCEYKGDYILWQYTSKGTIPGIAGTVDLSRAKEQEQRTPSVLTPARAVIEIALAEENYLEKRNGDLQYLYVKAANAGSQNYTKYGYEMHQIYPAVMDYPAAWCDAFVDWCFMKAYGVANAKGLLGGDFDDYTVRSAALYKAKGAYYKSDPKPGDQIFFRNASGICHTGLVYSVNKDYVYTIEGNTSSASGVVANGGCVRKKAYSLKSDKIDGYGRPNYSDSTVTQKIVSAVKESIGAAVKLDAAQKFDARVAGSYQVTASALNMRSGAGTNKKVIAVVPRNAIVRCYGYYSLDGSRKWLYVVYGTQKGFCTEEYLRKI